MRETNGGDELDAIVSVEPELSVDPERLQIASRRDGVDGVVVLAGELDLAGGDAVENAVTGLLAEGATRIWVQAGELRFMDSSGLGGLLAAREKAVEQDAEFRFGPMSEIVARVIDLAGVHDLLGAEAS
jgi:anti-sigma B factor antagonist